MYDVKMIACVDLDYNIGYNNELLFHIKDDMKHFVNLTKGKTVVMGLKTWLSIPEKNRPLSDRHNIILTTHPEDFKNGENYEFMTLYEFQLKVAKEQMEVCSDPKQIYVIGGEIIYNLFIDTCNTINLTIVMTVADKTDACLPKNYITKEFYVENRSEIYYDTENDLYYYFETLKRKNNNKDENR